MPVRAKGEPGEQMETSPRAARGSLPEFALSHGQGGTGDQQQEDQASDKNGHEPDVRRPEPRRLVAASVALVVVVQLLWAALLVYGVYWVAAWLVR